MFSKSFPISSSLAARAAIAATTGVALAGAFASATPAAANTLVSAIMGYGNGTNNGSIVVPANGTVAAAPSTGQNQWSGSQIDIAFSSGTGVTDFSALPDSNGNTTTIGGSFTTTNPTYQDPYYAWWSKAILPPFVNFPSSTELNGQYDTDASSPTKPYGPDTLALTGLNPVASYDVYVYSAYTGGMQGTGSNTPTVSLTLTDGTAAVTSYTYTYNMSASGLLSSYQPGTNYEEFQGVTPDSAGGIAITGTGVNTSLFNAFQIYTVPEPATLGLMAVAGVGMLLLKRRRTA